MAVKKITQTKKRTIHIDYEQFNMSVDIIFVDGKFKDVYMSTAYLLSSPLDKERIKQLHLVLHDIWKAIMEEESK